jgi:hypothetical protein
MVMNDELIVCGDSFMSPRIDYPGAHFSEILAEKLGLNLMPLSRAGISNGGIALQLISAIKRVPKLILFNLTFHDRIEFRLSDIIEEPISLDSISYNMGSTELSTQNKKLKPLASDNLLGLLSNNANSIYKKSKLKAIKNYFNELYCSDWKRQTDCMMMYAVLHTLNKSGIPYIMVMDNLILRESPCPIDWLSEKNDVSQALIEVFNRPLSFDPGFHTSLESQQEIADFLLSHCNKYFK